MADLALDQFVTFRLLRLTNQLNRQAIRILAQCTELRLPEWRCLAIIDAYGSQQVNQIAARLSADKGLISRSLASLEAAGLVVMARNTRDRRQVTAALTAAGKGTVDRVMPIMNQRQNHLLGALSARERKDLYRLIEKLQGAAEDFDEANLSEAVI